MFVTFKYKAVAGIGTYRGVHILYNEVSICIEQENAEKAMALANIIGNNDKVIGVADVTTEKPTDRKTVFIDQNGFVSSETDYLIQNADIQSFVLAIKAGIQMHRNLIS